jgi:hypothetical protein
VVRVLVRYGTLAAMPQSVRTAAQLVTVMGLMQVRGQLREQELAGG